MHRIIDIAEEIGCTPSTIRRYAHQLGIGRKRDGITSALLFTDEEVQQIKVVMGKPSKIGRPRKGQGNGHG